MSTTTETKWEMTDEEEAAWRKAFDWLAENVGVRPSYHGLTLEVTELMAVDLGREHALDVGAHTWSEVSERSFTGCREWLARNCEFGPDTA